MKKILLLAALFCLLPPAAEAAVKGREVTYQANGTKLKGYLAYDTAFKGRRPAVLVVHEWWGHNDYARKRANMLAELGYTALAVDMYGDGKQAEHPEEAGKFASEVSKNMPLARARFEAAMKLLRKQRTVNPRKMAAIGYCFGGGVVLNMARLGEDLKGVASFHGMLSTANPAQPGKVKARIIVFTGEDDPMVRPDTIGAFEREMDDAGVKYHVVIYPGAKHAFTNRAADELGRKFDLPLAYNLGADLDSWQQLIVFLREIFAGK